MCYILGMYNCVLLVCYVHVCHVRSVAFLHILFVQCLTVTFSPLPDVL
jgi:hypothetical protein